MRAIVSLKLNEKSIRDKIDKALANSPTVKRIAYKKAYGIFYNAKRAMLKAFDRHPITQELLGGAKAVNISGTLDGYGNLFSFLGFHAGSKPTEELRELLEIATDFRQTVYRNRTWYFRTQLPGRDVIESKTQMPWEGGNSWAYAVERNVSGLSHYMYKRWGGSRSGMGFQLPYENMEDLVFQPQPYISEILNEFRKRINKS
jgi:hypothetical protein